MIDRGQLFIISVASTAAVLLIIISILIYQVSSLNSQMEKTTDFYRTRLEDQRIAMDELVQNMQILASGGNEVRRYMNLPEKELIRRESEAHSESIDPAVSFFDAFRFLVSHEEEEYTAAEFSNWISDRELEEYFSSKNYSFKRQSYISATVGKDNEVLLTIAYNKQESEVDFSDIAGNSFSLPYGEVEITETLGKSIAILNAFENQVEQTKVSLAEIAASPPVNEILRNRGILLVEESNPYAYHILNKKDDSKIGSIGHNGPDYLLNNKKYSMESEFEESLIAFLKSVDIETEYERIDKIVLAKMEEVFDDEGFKVLLESENCSTDLGREEDEEFISFHIYRKDGTVKGTFALQKEFGEVLLISGDGKYLKSLDMFTPDFDFRSLIINGEEEAEPSPYEFDDSTDTFLVVGTHEHNADTMIIVHADNKAGTIKMISFPRDLYYKGNKINNIYKEQGPEELARELSEITGLSIKKYISIDMFAFIDVINILGGIDVTLDSDLVDPTYKVKNNGVWSTLYYRKGTHHLDGVAALRVARSRHGSEAYDRSRRQQLVIKAIMDKMVSLNAGDMATLYEFVTSVFSYIDTNLTIADLVKNFVMYKDNQIEDPNTINTDNILDAEWTNTYLLPEEEKEEALKDDDFFKGQWIVLPKGNDWELFRNHIENILFSGI